MSIKIIAVIFLLSPCLSYAQIQEPIVSQGLTQGLSELKNSVDQLAVSNENLASKNVKLKERLSSAQAAVQKLNQENQELTNAKLKLEVPTPSKTKQMQELEKKIADVDAKIGKLKEQMKAVSDTLESNRQEDQSINGKADSQVAEADEETASATLELSHQKKKEKLAFLKMISDSQARQMFLQEQLLDLQKNPPGSESGASYAGRKAKLEAEIKQLELENSQLAELPNHLTVRGEEDMRRLEQSVNDLEKNRNELEGLVLKMQKKAQNIHLTSDQKSEQAKLQYNIDQLKTEAKTLRLDLEESQQQMVELDKRKAYLESLLQK
jgi:DNA repair exonuclease SbcCD ATPase subunit